MLWRNESAMPPCQPARPTPLSTAPRKPSSCWSVISPSSRSGLRGRGISSSAYRGRYRGWSRSLLRTLFVPGWARRRRRTSRVRGPPNRRRRRAQTSYGFLAGDLLHGDLAVFEVRGVAGVYDAGPVQAVLSILALPGTLPDGLDEALDNGIMSFAGFYLGSDYGGHAGHVGVDADGIAGAVVPHFHLRSTVGTVKGDAEVVARLAVGGPAGLQVQRGPTGETDECCRQVLDLVWFVPLHEPEIAPAAPPARAAPGVGCAANARYLGLAHKEDGHIHHVHSKIYERAAARKLLAGEPAAHARDAVAAHPGSLGVVDPAQVPLLDVTLERLDIAPLALGEGDVHRAVCLPGSAYYPLSLSAVACQRLLAEHVPAAFEGGHGDGGVQVVRRPYTHDVEVVTGDELLPAGVQVLYAVAPAELAQPDLFEPGERHGLHTRYPHEVLQVLLARVTEADDPGTQGFCRRSLSLQTVLLLWV